MACLLDPQSMLDLSDHIEGRGDPFGLIHNEEAINPLFILF